MDKGSDKNLGEGEKAEPETAKTLPSATAATSGDPAQPRAIDASLPVVESPKLNGSEETVKAADAEAVHETPAEPAGEAAAPAMQPRSWRFALLAATFALAVAVGALLGSLTASGLGQLMPAAAPGANTADASTVLPALKARIAEFSAMKSNLEDAIRSANSQFTAIAARLDRVEHAAANPTAQPAHIADTVDRLSKLNAAPETTGAVATGAAAAGSQPKLTDRIVADWVVQDVRGGRALVESRNGGLFDVGAGSMLPGLGRVETVKRQDGQWVVVTARGLITSGR